MKESEVRYCLIDPLIKGLHNLTDVKVKLEESVKDSEKSDSANEVSNKSVPDFSVYILYTEQRPIKIFFLEAKTFKSVNIHSICQSIGYYMASETVYKDDDDKIYPPLSLVLTERFGRLVYFPYYTPSKEPCVDAAVSSPIELFSNQQPKGLIALLTFITSYILLASKQEKPISIIMDTEHTLHKKQVYKNYVLPEEVYLQSLLEQKEQELQEMQQEMQQKLQQKDQEMQQKDQEMQQKDQEMQQKLQQKDQEMQQKDQEMQQKLEQLAINLGMSVDKVLKMTCVTPPFKKTKFN